MSEETILVPIEVPTYYFALTEELAEACKGTKFKSEDFIPTKSEPDASGWDVRCAQPDGLDLTSCCYYTIPLGFRSYCPKGWWAKLDPRSSSFTKRHMHALYGNIDETYPKQWFFACQYIPDGCALNNKNYPTRLEFGDRIGQLIPVRKQEMNVEVLTNAAIEEKYIKRDAVRKDGFGSSGSV